MRRFCGGYKGTQKVRVGRARDWWEVGDAYVRVE